MITDLLSAAPTKFSARGLALLPLLAMLREEGRRGDRILTTFRGADQSVAAKKDGSFEEHYHLTEVGLTRNEPIGPNSIVKIATILLQGKLALEIELTLQTGQVCVKSRDGHRYDSHNGHAFDFIIDFSKYIKPAHLSPIVALKKFWSACVMIFLDEALYGTNGMLITGRVKGEKLRQAIPKSILNSALEALPKTSAIDNKQYVYIEWSSSKIICGSNIWVDVEVKYPDNSLIPGLNTSSKREICCTEYVIYAIKTYPSDPIAFDTCLSYMQKLIGKLTKEEFHTGWTAAFAYARVRHLESLWRE